MDKFNTGYVMKSIFHGLLRDFRILLKDPTFGAAHQAALNEGVPALRDLNLDVKGEFFYTPLHFKCKRQIDFLFKRFRFESDKYTDVELQKLAEAKFLDTQANVALNESKGFTPRALMCLDKARWIVFEILGSFDVDEHVKSCQFAKRATVGNPYLRSHLDKKLSEDLITGSPAQHAWFQDIVREDPLLEASLTSPPFKIWSERKCVVDCVPVEFVPKSYKSLRTIRKNTLIGNFYTSGIGTMIRRRLKGAGLNIPTLSNRHRKLVLKMSRNRSLVTADLSAASDSFSTELVRYLLPYDWFTKIQFARIGLTKVGHQQIELASFMTMGEGHTFPLQTLLFYSVLKAIQQLTGIQGLISVFGDDLIYPTRMHPYVQGIFSDLGFQLNMEKTYVWQNFRESCGEDAYMGLPVRPWHPEGCETVVQSKTAYAAFLYTCINGLLERWKWNQIPNTMWELVLQLGKTGVSVFQVPPDFPDYAGIRTSVIEDLDLFPWSPVVTKRACSESNWIPEICFQHIGVKSKMSGVHWQYPYIWNCLRSKCIDNDFDEFHEPIVLERLKIATLESLPGDFEVIEDVPVIRWAYKKTKPWKSKATSQTYRYKLVPRYFMKQSNLFTSSSSVVNYWGAPSSGRLS